MNTLIRGLLSGLIVFSHAVTFAGAVPNADLLAEGVPWTNDDNRANGWQLRHGYIHQGASNDDSRDWGDRLLLLEPSLPELHEGEETVLAVDMLLAEYGGENGIWQGVVLFLDTENPSPSGGVSVVIERADAEGIYGGLRIHHGATMSAYAPLGPLRWHEPSIPKVLAWDAGHLTGRPAAPPDLTRTQHPTWDEMAWVRLIVTITQQGADAAIRAEAVPLVGSGQGTVSAGLETTATLHTLPGRGIALGTSAQFGREKNPAVYFDNFRIGGPELRTAPEIRPITRELAAEYLAPEMARLPEWPELVWDPPHIASDFFTRLNAKTYRLQQRMDRREFLELAAEPAIRAHTWLGGINYIREILTEKAALDGTPTDGIEALVETHKALLVILNDRANRRYQRVVAGAEQFTEGARQLGCEKELDVARLHSLFHVVDKTDDAAYWELADRLMQELPPGDLRNRTAYNRIVKLQKDGRHDQAIEESEAFLLADPNTDYRPMLLSSLLGAYYMQKRWDQEEALAQSLVEQYPDGTLEHWKGRLHLGLVAYLRDQDYPRALDIFVSLADNAPDFSGTAPGSNSMQAIEWAIRCVWRLPENEREEWVDFLLSMLSAYPRDRRVASLEGQLVGPFKMEGGVIKSRRTSPSWPHQYQENAQ